MPEKLLGPATPGESFLVAVWLSSFYKACHNCDSLSEVNRATSSALLSNHHVPLLHPILASVCELLPEKQLHSCCVGAPNGPSGGGIGVCGRLDGTGAVYAGRRDVIFSNGFCDDRLLCVSQDLPLARSPVAVHLRGYFSPSHHRPLGLENGLLHSRTPLASLSLWKVNDEGLADAATEAIGRALMDSPSLLRNTTWRTLHLGLLPKVSNALLLSLQHTKVNLTCVTLEACSFRPSHTQALCQMIESLASLEFLSLRLNPCLAWLDVFQSAGRAASSRITLDAGLCGLVDELLVRGAELCLRELHDDDLKEIGLDLSQNRLSSAGLLDMTKGVKARSPCLTSLDLSGHALASCGGTLALMIAQHSGLTSLGLDRCDLSTSDVTRAIKALGQRPMTKLSLAGNKLAPAAIKAVLGTFLTRVAPRQMAEKSPLATSAQHLALDLSGNASDGETLAAGLTTSSLRHLKSLDLSNMSLGSDGLVVLSVALSRAASSSPMALECLLLGSNDISQTTAKEVRDGVQYLAKALRCSSFPMLRVLALPHNDITLVKPLCTLLDQCSPLLSTLDLSHNPDALFQNGLEALVSTAVRRRACESSVGAFDELDIVTRGWGSQNGAATTWSRLLEGQLHVRVIH